MTDYYPYRSRKSLLESCLLNAFSKEWKTKEVEVLQDMQTKKDSGENTKASYESFNFAQADQNFELGDSELFTDLTMLYSKMEEIKPSDFDKSPTRHNSRDCTYSYIKKTNFDSSLFDVMQIDDKLSFVDAIKFLHSFYIGNPELLYGVLLHDGNKFINPLHPINAQAICKKMITTDLTKDFEEKKYKIIIYTYKDKEQNKKRNSVSRLYEEKFEGLFVNHIISALAMLDVKTNFGTKITKYYTVQEINSGHRAPDGFQDAYHWSKFMYNWEETNLSGNKTGYDISLQPVQLVNTGIAIPYYGIVAEKKSKENGLLGYQLSPMLSCNIGEPMTITYKDNSLDIYGLSICTGNYNSTSMDGKLSLNHANLNSPYFSNIMGNGALTFAEVSVKIALSVYAEAFDMERINFMPKQAPIIPPSFEEFKKENPNAKLKEYLESIKQG